MSEQSGLRVLLAVDGSVHLDAAVMLAAHLGKLAHRQLQGEALH